MAASDRNEEDRQLAEQLTQSLQVTQTLVNTLMGEIRKNAGEEATLNQLREEVSRLSKIIQGEAGDNGLVTRVKIIEGTVSRKAEQEKEDNAGKWQIYAAWIAGILGIIGAVITVFWK